MVLHNICLDVKDAQLRDDIIALHAHTYVKHKPPMMEAKPMEVTRVCGTQEEHKLHKLQLLHAKWHDVSVECWSLTLIPSA